MSFLHFPTRNTSLHSGYVSQKSIHRKSSLSSRLPSGMTRTVHRNYVYFNTLYLALPARMHGVETLRGDPTLVFRCAGRALRGGYPIPLHYSFRRQKNQEAHVVLPGVKDPSPSKIGQVMNGAI